MQFINPKTDFAFKKIFGSSENKNILKSFLNALIYQGQPIIEDLEIIDPALSSKISGLKDTYLDVKAKINDGKTVIIEMQVLNVSSFAKRVIYNAAKTYATQLGRGEGYSKLKPVIALTITDFEMFGNNQKVISHFLFKETDDLFDYPDPEIELFFVELPKFNKNLEELETITDKWIYFMKNAPSLEIVPEKMGEISEIQQAFAIANEANLSREELEDLEKREMVIEDQRNLILRGRQEGRQEGLEEGMRKKALEIAKQFLNVVDDQTISQKTGLTLDDIQQLRQG
ncbi:MAG: Rpn family recombination-promoting nuclease/putative transposase [Microcoleaceae cyanobacterium]|jgi:predicted transposase/invertase (TIGR01784 family)